MPVSHSIDRVIALITQDPMRVEALSFPLQQAVVLNPEHTEYKWCTLEEALELAPFPNQHAVFKHVWSYFVEKPINEHYQVNINQLANLSCLI